MYVSVGSLTNDFEGSRSPEDRRADILEFDPDGKNERIYASGIRNAVGLAIHPKTQELWCSVNERDALGNDLVPDYITRVKENGFYGWPWFYIGPHQDPRHEGEKLEMKDKVLVPEVLLQSHMASLCITFYTGTTFPKEFTNDGFAAPRFNLADLSKPGDFRDGPITNQEYCRRHSGFNIGIEDRGFRHRVSNLPFFRMR